MRLVAAASLADAAVGAVLQHRHIAHQQAQAPRLAHLEYAADKPPRRKHGQHGHACPAVLHGGGDAQRCEQGAHGKVPARGNGRAFRGGCAAFSRRRFFSAALRAGAAAVRKPCAAAPGSAAKACPARRAAPPKARPAPLSPKALLCAAGPRRAKPRPQPPQPGARPVLSRGSAVHNRFSVSAAAYLCLSFLPCSLIFARPVTARQGGISAQWQGPRARRPPRRT